MSSSAASASAPSVSASDTVEQPLDLIRLSLDERVLVKCRGGRELRGVLHLYDSHLNLILGAVEETITSTHVNADTLEELVHTSRRSVDLLFVRGDAIILIAPPTRTH